MLKEVRESMEDKPRTSCSSTSRVEDIEKRIRDLVNTVRRLKVCMVEDP